MKKFGPREHVSLRDFLRFYVFLNKMVKNGPRNMKFGTNVVFTIENKKKLNNRTYLENLTCGTEGFFGPHAFFTILCFPDRLVKNGPMYMKFGMNVDFTITKKIR